MTSPATETTDEAATSSVILERVRAERQVADRAEATILELAVAWAHAHPAVPGDDSWRITSSHATPYLEGVEFGSVEELEDYGIPEVHWAAPAAFASANGMSTTGGKALLRDALILVHRLPQTWAQIHTGRLPAWRGRRIARAVLGAPSDVVTHIDQALAGIAHKVGPIQLDRLLDHAMLTLHAEEHEIAQTEALARRHATLHQPSLTDHGLADMSLRADWQDLRDFDQTLSQIAAKLKSAPEGEHESLDVRRSRAIGVLADPARALALLSDQPAPPPSREVVLYVHLTDQTLVGHDTVARTEAEGRAVLEQQVRDWCGRTDAHVSVKPVIDLAEEKTVDAYAIPTRMAERVKLRHPTCVFPWCTQPSRGCDLDHITPYAAGGLTSDANLAPLCRHHHRLKTHAGWRYTRVEPEVFLWTDPHHHAYLRDRDGTTDVGVRCLAPV
jgi:hypothetical protein